MMSESAALIGMEQGGPTQNESLVRVMNADTRQLVDVEIVVPAFNEEQRILRGLRAVIQYLSARPYSSRVTVIDNGSVDSTADLVRDLGRESIIEVRVISCSRRGKGAAVRRGMLAANAKFIGFIDADIATPIDTLEPTINMLFGGVDVVVASRRCPGAQYLTRQPLLRRIGGRGFRVLSRRYAPAIADTQCGFKFFRADVAHSLFSQSRLDGFVFDLEILALAHVGGYCVREIPVLWRNIDGSTLSIWRDSAQIASQLRDLRHRFRSIHTNTTISVGIG